MTVTWKAMILLLAVSLAFTAAAQNPLSTSATEPYRFIAVHGHRSAVLGYASRGLEVWGYPYQILDHYTVDFQPEGTLGLLRGENVLTRVEVGPDSVNRIWTGPGFQVKETAFVPPDQPDAILRYEVSGSAHVDLVITFRPVLDLMWPASAGGQDVRWDDALHGYELTESTYGYEALLASEQIAAHTPLVNSAHREDLTQSFRLHPQPENGGVSVATVYTALVPPDGDPHAVLQQLTGSETLLRQQAQEQLHSWKDQSVVVTTPDEEINRALAWADTDLEQAWACDDKIGCGAVAGYGPSRPMRRPQYDWFFAGDGMVAAEAMLASGHMDRAREELEFILRYQNPTNGMIWHEMSQSAAFLDWKKYPYLYPHVDLSFQFLSFLGDYYAATGDLPFITSHWSAITAAFHFCQSLVDQQTGLPMIPADKMGANEQDRENEDAGLSAAWIAAAAAYARVARDAGYPQQADAADALAQRARAVYAERYWNNAEQFWISGYTAAGHAMNVRRSEPTAALTEHLFPPAQENKLLDELAGAAFQTDWGTRSMAADSPQYDPDSYAKGSVSALHSAEMAQAFWSTHRPITAWQIWSGLVPWSRLDSLGHMHEVLTGNVFAPQVESVPEQTWSSAAFLSAAIHGLFGVDVDAPAHHLTLSPHHFPGGGTVMLENLHAAGAVISATIETQQQSVDILLKNDGSPVALTLAPDIPLGASQVRVLIAGRSVPVKLRTFDQEQQAAIDFRLQSGVTHCRIMFDGGVWIEVPRADPTPGATSSAPRIRHVALHGTDLQIELDAPAGAETTIGLDTPWPISGVEGGTIRPGLQNHTMIVVKPAASPAGQGQFVDTTIHVHLQNEQAASRRDEKR